MLRPAGVESGSRSPSALVGPSGVLRIAGEYKLEGPGPHSASALRERRADFWSSREGAGGSPAAWSSLKLASEALLAGDVALAETVLEALDFRPARGDLSLVYAPGGSAYEVPPFAWREPANVVSDAEAARRASAARRPHSGPALPLDVTLRLSASATSREQDVRLALRSDMTGDAVAAALSKQLASGLADQSPDPSSPRVNRWSEAGGCAPARLRLLFRGRTFAQDACLQELGVKSGDIMQVREGRRARRREGAMCRSVAHEALRSAATAHLPTTTTPPHPPPPPPPPSPGLCA